MTLHHQYSGDPEQSKTWADVQPGETTSALTVGYNAGIIGTDWWWVQYRLPDNSVWLSPLKLRAPLEEQNNGQTLTFTIAGSLFTTFIGVISQLLEIRDKPMSYNSWAVISLRNNLPVAVSATLTHRYSDNTTYQHDWLAALPPGATTSSDEAFIVYFYTGLISVGSDYWNISAKLDIPPYDNAPATAFAAISNATTDKSCMLQESDNGRSHTFTVDGSGLTLGIYSGSCTDQWKTWHGYNTLAFFQVMNNFSVDISSIVVTHRYFGDATWRQTRALVLSGAISPLMVAEFNIGFLRVGSDHWDVYVYLQNGFWYQNHTSGFACMLTVADAVTVSTFSVTPGHFAVSLPSGPCTDSMDYKGTFSPNAGRDPQLPYDQNAFIGSHNAYANFAAGFWYAQQAGSIETQLALGATTFLLDIWYRDGEIYLLHGDIGVLQPFVVNQTLADALVVIRAFLQAQSRDPVTIIFEDHVGPENQGLIKVAFLKSRTWEMTFNPDVYDVGRNGWPTLAEFFALGQPLIVFTSNQFSTDFAYQWLYMSENVYGDASIDQETWLNPRSESQPLSQLALCALNHFPTWSLGSFSLNEWLNRSALYNAAELLAMMIDDCYAKWGRLPNYLNADFWEVPADGLVMATVRLNQWLRGGGPEAILRIENGRAILTDIDHSRLLRGDWERAARWVDQHLSEICPQPDPDLPGPIVHQLVNAINLTLVVSTLHSILPSGDSPVRAWTDQAVSVLAGYLRDIEPAVLAALGVGMTTVIGGELCAIPYFLIERASEAAFEVTSAVRSRLAGPAVSANHDQLLLAGLAGNADAVAQLAGRLAPTRAAAAVDHGTSALYDLTHEIIYLAHVRPGAVADPALAADIDSLVAEVMAANFDLGAELLACYWITGGADSPASRTAAERLKAANEEMTAECCTGRDGSDRCLQFKEQVHSRLTMVLGLGATLAVAGEILTNHGS